VRAAGARLVGVQQVGNALEELFVSEKEQGGPAAAVE